MSDNKYKYLLRDCKTIIDKFNDGEKIDSGDFLSLALSYSLATYDFESSNKELKELLNIK